MAQTIANGFVRRGRTAALVLCGVILLAAGYFAGLYLLSRM